jgi:uncharacterized protein
MRLDVSDIKLEAGAHKRFPLSVQLDSVLESDGQEIRFGPFDGEGEIWNIDGRLLVSASVSGEVEMVCSRCLSPVTVPLEVSFEEEFIEGDPESVPEADEEEEVRAVSFFQGDEIDLTEALRENILLELPMKPLCREECEGLCPTCGANRNENPCTCEGTGSVDPRLAILKDLLKPDTNS